MITSAFAVRRLTSGTTFRSASQALLAGTVAFVAPAWPAGVAAQAIRRAPTGFNLFSVEQDVEVGRRSVTEIERRVKLVESARADRFLTGLVSVLSANAPKRYAFQLKVVSSADVSLLVLPGGPIYVSTGLLALARSEGEMAGVVSHAMAHVILRHGTEQVSRTYLGRAGLSALGGRGATPSRIVEASGGFGLEGAFLRFSLGQEYEADALGAELMSQAGYDPVAMVGIFGTLRRERRRPMLERLTANHPPSPDREERIRQLVNVLGHRGLTDIVGGYSAVRWVGGSYPGRQARIAKSSDGTVAPRPTPISIDVPAPSAQYTRYTHPDAFVTIDRPSNWDAYVSGLAISFAPAGGVIDRKDGEPSLLQGVVVNLYEPFDDEVDRWNRSLTQYYAPFLDRTRPRGGLEDATDDLVRQILGANPYLSAPTGSARAETIEGARGYSVKLSGRSPITGDEERVTVYTRLLPDEHVVYLACVTPGNRATAVERACARMVQSLRVNDAAAHR